MVNYGRKTVLAVDSYNVGDVMPQLLRVGGKLNTNDVASN